MSELKSKYKIRADRYFVRLHGQIYKDKNLLFSESPEVLEQVEKGFLEKADLHENNPQETVKTETKSGRKSKK